MTGLRSNPFVHRVGRRLADSNCCKASERNEHVNAPQRPGFVYFIQEGTDGPIKVGYATDPEVRLARLQVANPETLYLRAAVLVRERGVEGALHGMFARHHIRGEWFHPHADLLGVIAQAADPSFALRLAPVDLEPDPALAPDDDDFNIELFEAGEVACSN